MLTPDPSPTVPGLPMRPREAAAALSISERTLWQWTKEGVVPCVKIGATTLYPTAQRSEFLAERAKRTACVPEVEPHGIDNPRGAIKNNVNSCPDCPN